MRSRILLVEDEPGLQMTLKDLLAGEGLDVEVADDGEQGLQRASEEAFDLILLDVMLPGKNGFDICRDLRQRGIRTPILMLTARGQTIDKVLGLKLGADDYLTKPFEAPELLARMEALLRRAAMPAGTSTGYFRFGDLIVDSKRTEVLKRGAPLALSALEFQLLLYFVRHPGETIARERLLQEVWGYESSVFTRTVDVHVAQLRQKLEDDPRSPRYLLTVRGLGYRFEAV